MTYVYDLARELTSETVDTVTKTYTYDVAGQVTSDGVASYTYDVGGNRSNGSQVIGTGNRLTSDCVDTYNFSSISGDSGFQVAVVLCVVFFRKVTGGTDIAHTAELTARLFPERFQPKTSLPHLKR
ncbi:MAG: hypothetical protein QM703_19280 [Gemmatales bacterium]